MLLTRSLFLPLLLLLARPGVAQTCPPNDMLCEAQRAAVAYHDMAEDQRRHNEVLEAKIADLEALHAKDVVLLAHEKKRYAEMEATARRNGIAPYFFPTPPKHRR